MSVLPPSSLESLQQTLTHEIEDYRQLAALTHQERVALQSGNLDDLIATVGAKESLLTRLSTWERNRQQLIAHLAAILKKPASITLSELLTFCDDNIAQKLSALRQEFIALVEQIRGLSQGNQLLLQAELVRVDVTVNYLLAAITPGGYQPVHMAGNPAPKLPVAGNMLNWRV